MTREGFNRRIKPLRDLLEPLSDKYRETMLEIHCVEADDETFDNEEWPLENLCLQCATTKRDDLEKEHPEHEFFIRACGYDCEEDSNATCLNCGVPLAYALVWIDDEFYHFVESGQFQAASATEPRIAYEILQLATALCAVKPERIIR